MSTTSKKYFSEKLRKTVWDEFLQEIKSLKTEENLFKLLNKYFTDYEKNILEKRLMVLFLLKQGKGFRETAREADVALNTVNFIKKGFKIKRKPKKEIKVAKRNFPTIQKKFPKYPTYTGKGRWRFLDMD